MQWKKIVTFILIIILSLSAVYGSALFAQNYAIINQYDVAFKTSEYSYCGHYFWENGCGPASVANALIAGLGITDEETAAGILFDVMHIMSSNPRTHNIDIKRYVQLPYRGNTLQQIYKENNWDIICYETTVSPEVIASIARPSTLIFCKAKNEQRWEVAIEYAKALAGTNAVIYMVRVGTGTASVQGPLAFGQAGHFVTLCLPVDKFLETGAIYLLDSAPCALAGESYGKDCYYKMRYPFVSNPRGHRQFLNIYGVERVQEEVIRFYLLDPSVDRVAAANMFTLYGAFFWLIVIP